MKKQDFLKGSVILMVSAAVSKLLGAVFRIPLTNMLGGVGMSFFSGAYSVFLPVYAFTVTGISSAAARMTARSMALEMYGNIRRIRRVALCVFSLAGMIGSLAVLLLAVPVSMLSAGGGDSAPAAVMIAPAVFFSCIIAVERGISEGMSNMYPTAVSQAVEGTVRAAAGLWLCSYAMSHSEALLPYFPMVSDVRGLGAAAGILGVTLSSAGAMVYFWILRLFRSGGIPSGGETHLESRRRIAAELIRSALPIGIGAVVTNLSGLVDMWTIIGCISRFGTDISTPVGTAPDEMPQFIYGSFSGIALTVFNLVPSVTNMLGKGVLPCITEAWSARDLSALRRSSIRSLVTAAVLAVPSAAVLSVLAPEVLYILFQKQSDEAAVCLGALRLLMPGMVFLCLSFPLFSMLQAIGRATVPLKIMAAAAVIKTAGNLLLVPLMGVNGAAVSTSVCYGLIMLLAWRAYVHASGADLPAAPVLSAVYSGVMCAGAVWLAADICRRNGMCGWGVVLVSAAAGGAVYLLCIMLSLGREYLCRLTGSTGKRTA